MPANNNLRRFFLSALASLFIFAVCFRAAYDFWAATVVFAGITLTTIGFVLLARNADRFFLPLLGPVFLYLLLSRLSWQGSFDLGSSYFETCMAVFTVVFFWLLINLTQSKRDWLWFFSFAGIALLPVAFLAFYQQCTGEPDGFGRWEIHATLLNANVMAGFALPWLYLSLELRQSASLKHYGSLLFACAVLIIGLSRSLATAFIASAGFLVYYRSYSVHLYRRFPRAITFGGIIIVAVAATLVAGKLADRIEGYYYGLGRIVYWKTALKMIVTHPFHGVGTGAFAYAYPFFRETTAAQATLFAHSSLLGWLAEVGLGGTFVLVWTVQELRRRNVNSGASTTIGLITMLLLSLGSIHLEYFVNKLLLTSLLAIVCGSAFSLSFRWNVLRKALVVGVFVFAIPFWLNPVMASRQVQSGLYEERLGHWDRALTYFQAASDLHSYDAEGYAGQARAYRQLKNEAAAAQAWKAAKQRRPLLAVPGTPFVQQQLHT